MHFHFKKGTKRYVYVDTFDGYLMWNRESVLKSTDTDPDTKLYIIGPQQRKLEFRMSKHYTPER